jgi:hypothetical protein
MDEEELRATLRQALGPAFVACVNREVQGALWRGEFENAGPGHFKFARVIDAPDVADRALLPWISGWEMHAQMHLVLDEIPGVRLTRFAVDFGDVSIPNRRCGSCDGGIADCNTWWRPRTSWRRICISAAFSMPPDEPPAAVSIDYSAGAHDEAAGDGKGRADADAWRFLSSESPSQACSSGIETRRMPSRSSGLWGWAYCADGKRTEMQSL